MLEVFPRILTMSLMAGKRSMPSPGSVEFVIDEEYRITVYDSPNVAEIRFGEEVRWYRLGWGDYNEAVDMVQPPDTLLERVRENGE